MKVYIGAPIAAESVGAYFMSNSFWTIFVLTWVFGPLVVWVSVLTTVYWYYRLRRSKTPPESVQSPVLRNPRRDFEVVIFKISPR